MWDDGGGDMGGVDACGAACRNVEARHKAYWEGSEAGAVGKIAAVQTYVSQARQLCWWPADLGECVLL